MRNVIYGHNGSSFSHTSGERAPALQGLAYQFTVLPFRLSQAPCVFTRCMGAGLSPFMPYLDDWQVPQIGQHHSGHNPFVVPCDKTGRSLWSQSSMTRAHSCPVRNIHWHSSGFPQAIPSPQRVKTAHWSRVHWQVCGHQSHEN